MPFVALKKATMDPSVPSDGQASKVRQARLLTGVGSSVVAKLITAGISFASLPLAIRYLGVEQYGVWITITTTIAWISLLDLGISDTLIGFIAKAADADGRRSVNQQVTNALTLAVSIAVGGSYLLWISRYRLPWGHLLRVSDNNSQQDTAKTLLLGCFVILVGLPCNLFYKILAGYQQLHISNTVHVIVACLSLVGLLCGIHFGLSMPSLFLVTTGMTSWVPLLGLIWLIFVYKPWLIPHLSSLNLRTMRSLLSSGSAFLIINVAGIIAFGSDNLVVGHYLTPSQVTPYAVTWRLAGYAGILQTLLFPALWPAYAEAFQKNDLVWIRKTLAWSIGVSAALNAAMLLLLLIGGKLFIETWAGQGAVPSFALLLVVGVWNMIAGFMAAQSNYLGAIGLNRAQAWLSLAAAILNISLSIILVRRIGVVGVVLGTIISYLVVLVVPQSTIVLRSLRIKRALE